YYDSNKNLISEKRNDNNAAYVTYSYNSDNELTEKVNYDTGLRYTYGNNDSVTVTKLSDDSVVQTYTQSSNEDSVDSEDAVVTTINESHFGTSYSSQVAKYSTTFTSGNNSIVYSFTNNSSNNVTTESVSYNNSQAFSTAYSYDSKENITSKAITLADNTTFNVVNTYDSKNRITSTGYGSAEQTYTYDQYGQLTQTVDAANGFTETYSYDQRGNILTKTKVYDDTSLPAETTTFSYGNAVWPDELTSVNGTSLTYDANGNVLTYGNMEFEWTNGRVLSEITVNPADPNGTADVYSYTYDESGIRSSKTVNGVTTCFTTKDGVILSQTDGTNTMYFQYDNSGNPTGFLYNGTQYFYLTNQMGDVIGITDSSGSLVATYTYGAWGEVLAVTPATTGNAAQLAIANANPLRYRGYYLDQETGYYYLQSRYYNPLSTRFLNADKGEIASISKDYASGNNLFVYCNNSPINSSDPTGTISIRIPRWIAITLFNLLASAIPGLKAVYYPLKIGIKQFVKKTSSYVLKNKVRGSLTSAVSKVFGYAGRLANALQKATKRLPLFKKYADKITATAIYSAVRKTAINTVVSKLINIMFKNIEIFLSIGGLIGGILDYATDRSLNGIILVNVNTSKGGGGR
ncbi:MAG: RHS repeat-associated core domain-containing protein, partial [Paraprevotella sp.]|nr:RHS repeat-associated core domain-containing protein [Paraprevotella sp.]